MLLTRTVHAQQETKYDEGTQVELSEADVAGLRKWIDNAQTSLNALTNKVRGERSSEQRKTFVDTFKSIVDASGKKENELLMRYVLNRALYVDNIVGTNPGSTDVDVLLSFFEKSVEMALAHYVDDAEYLKTVLSVQPEELRPMHDFALAYMLVAEEHAKRFLNPQSEYRVRRASLGWLSADLNSSRCMNTALFSEEILYIQDLVKNTYKENVSSTEVLGLIQQIKADFHRNILPKLEEKVSSLRPKSQKETDSFVLDEYSGLLWSAISPLEYSYKEASQYCKSLNENNPPLAGLKTWRLPLKEEFLVAFNPNNKDPDYNKFILKALSVLKTPSIPKDSNYTWTTSVVLKDGVNKAVVFNENNGWSSKLKIDGADKLTVRCVADSQSKKILSGVSGSNIGRMAEITREHDFEDIHILPGFEVKIVDVLESFGAYLVQSDLMRSDSPWKFLVLKENLKISERVAFSGKNSSFYWVL